MKTKKKENYTNSNFSNELPAIETNVLFPRRNANNADEYIINAKKLIQKLWRSCRKLTVLGAIKSDMEIAAISRDSD